MDCSRSTLFEYTEEERYLLEYFEPETENTGSGDSTSDFPLVGNNYVLPVDIWAQVKASCECLRSRVLPFLTVSSIDVEEKEQSCNLIILAISRLHFTKGFPAEWIRDHSKWNIPGIVQVDKKTFEEVRFELWLNYYSCL